MTVSRLLTFFIIAIIFLSACSPFVSSPQSETTITDQMVELSFKVIPLAGNFCPIEQMEIILLDDLPVYPQDQSVVLLTKTPDSYYKATIRASIGTTIHYQYRIDKKLIELAPNNQQAFFRSFSVNGFDEIQDVVSAWEGCNFETETGSISGQIYLDGSPTYGLWIQTAGLFTTTHADGTFELPDTPVGQYHLIVTHPDGRIKPYQQLVRVDPRKVTDVNLNLISNKLVDVTFIVTAPTQSQDSDLSIKLVSNQPAFGGYIIASPSNTFYSSTPLPELIHQDQNIYYISMRLYSGTDFRYYYTQGDEQWNTEVDKSHKHQIRHIFVPDGNLTINDSIISFIEPELSPIHFRIKTPENTPLTDKISLQLKQTNWTPPVTMNRVSDYVWEFALTSGYDPQVPLHYRFCRNGQCGTAGEETTEGIESDDYSLDPTTKERTVNHVINEWKWLPISDQTARLTVSSSIQEKDRNDYWSGMEWSSCMDSSWRNFIPLAIDRSFSYSPNWITIRPGFSIDPDPYQTILDVNQTYLLDQVKNTLVQYEGKIKPSIAIFPTPILAHPIEEWLKTNNDDPDGWRQWSELYQRSILDTASYAELNDFDAIIVGGEWIVPFLPPDSDPSLQISIAPSDADTYWVNLISEIRKVFNGKIVFALPAEINYTDPPVFLDKTDSIYSILTHPEQYSDNLKVYLTSILDSRVKVLQETYHKPIIIGINYPSIPQIPPQANGAMQGPCQKPYGSEWSSLAMTFPVDLQAQVNYYSILLYLINERDWVQGFVSQGYFPVVDTLDFSSSIGGKPAGSLIQFWNQSIFPN